MYFSAPHKPEKGFVLIDSHILCTPAIGDIDGDGHEELVVAASYFFDRDYYDAPVSLRMLAAIWVPEQTCVNCPETEVLGD